MKTDMKTLSGDRVVLVPGSYDEVCSARCEGCGWIDPPAGWVALVSDVRRAARLHAESCTGNQGALW